jgi:hypothetical protein
MTYKCGVMKSTVQLEKENLIPVGKCLLLPWYPALLSEEVGIYPSGYRLVTTKNISRGVPFCKLRRKWVGGLHFLGI